MDAIDSLSAPRSAGVGEPSKPSLVHPWADGLLVGWLGVGLWAFAVFAPAPAVAILNNSTALLWTATAVQAAHFAMSYRLSYADGARALRQHPIALGLFPLVLAVVTVGIAIVAASAGVAAVQSVTSFLISAVFITSGFHFVRQSYGVARIGFSYAKASLQPWENRALRLAVYPIWLVGLRPLLSDQGGIGYLGFEVGPAILNGAVFACLEAAAWIAVASVVAVYLRVWSRGVRPTGLMVAPYAVIVVWMIAPIGQIAAASLAFSLVHALQYLACCYRVERNRAGGEGIPGLVTWFYVVVVAACLGIVATRGLPGWLDQTWGTPGQPLLFSALAFVYLNLTHYVTDAVIWKSSGSLLKPRLHSG